MARSASTRDLKLENNAVIYPRPLRKQLCSLTGIVLASCFIATLAGCDLSSCGDGSYEPGQAQSRTQRRHAAARLSSPTSGMNGTGLPSLRFQGNRTVVSPQAVGNGVQGVGLMRQQDCSLTAFFLSNFNSMTNGFTSSTVPNFDKVLHNTAGLRTTAGQFPHGCQDPPEKGISARSAIYLGKAPNGSLIGANIDITNLVHAGTLDPVAGTVTATQLVVANANMLAAGDLRNTGNQDLLVETFPPTSTGVSTVSIFFSDGSGNFRVGPQTVQTANPSVSLTVDDINGDGKPDLLITELGPGGVNAGSQLLFLPGIGDGTFGAPVATPIPAASFLATGDFNGDGKRDVVLGDGTILLGKGDGTFTVTASSINLSENSSDVPVVGDWNGDGKDDLAFNDQRALIIHIFTGNGDGTFQQGTSYSSIFGAHGLQATDIDGDGRQDLLVGEGNGGIYGPAVNSGGVFMALMGNGDGTFVGTPVHESDIPGTTSAGFAVADFTGDGKADVLTASTFGLELFTGDGKGNFTTGKIINSTTPLVQVVAADINGDGKQDAVFLEQGATTAAYDLAVALGNGDGTFLAKNTVNLGTAANPSGVTALAAGDFNGDGKPDVIVAIDTSVFLLLNQGNGTLGAPTNIATEPNPVTSVAIADLNGDGKMDLVLTEATAFIGTTQGHAVVLLGNGDGTYKPAVNYSASFSPLAVAVADMNKDGKLDLVVGGTSQDGTTGTLSVFLGNGDGTFGAAINTKLNESFVTSLAVADFDGDGKPDVVLGNCCGLAFTSVALGAGDGTFSNNFDLGVALSSSSVTAMDLNGDGRPDILLAQSTGNSSGFDVLLNLYGATAGATVTTTALTVNPTAITAGQPVTLTATVTGATGSTGTATGTVTFNDGTTSLGTGTVNSSGVATLTTAALPVGAQSITAVYGGDTVFATSSSTAVTVTVTASTLLVTATALTVSASTIAAGQPLTLTATVTGPAGNAAIPTGLVVFTSSGPYPPIGTGTLAAGVATFTTTALPVGMLSLGANYGGDSTFAASMSPAVAVTITAPLPDFGLMLIPANASVSHGQPTSTTVSVGPLNGFSQAVSLTCSGLPALTTCGFAPATVTPSGAAAATSTLTVTTDAKTPAAAMRAAGLAGDLGGGAGAELPVALGGLWIAVWLLRRRTGAYTRLLLVFAALTVTLGMVACGSSAAGTPAGSYTITVNATGGGVTHSTPFSLTVR